MKTEFANNIIEWEHHPVAFLSGRVPLAVYTLTFSMLSLYCFLAWFPSHVFLPILPGSRWLYLSGLWAWGWPLLALALPFKRVGVPLHSYQTRHKPLEGGSRASSIRSRVV